MPKEYLPYPVTDEWCADVKAELAKRGRGAQERLREYIESRGLKCSSGELSDTLNHKVITSEFVEPIHEWLKWPRPMPPTASRDAGELAHIYARIPEERRKLYETFADAMNGKSGDEARAMLETLLRMIAEKPKT